MAWETRRKRGRYYTRSRWVNGRVERQYVGTGPRAEKAAAEDARCQAERRAEAAAARDVMGKLDAADAPVRELDMMADLLIRCALTAAGYHQHDRGSWRRRRSDGTGH